MAIPSFNKDLGPCHVYWNDEYVGPTNGGVKVKIEGKFADIKEDGQGVIAVDAVFTGYDVAEIDVPLTRSTLDILETLIHGSDLDGDVLSIFNQVGDNMYPLAKELELRPAINNVASVTSTEYMSFPKTYPVISNEPSYDLSNQRVWKTKFKVFPKAESPDIGVLAYYGD